MLICAEKYAGVDLGDWEKERSPLKKVRLNAMHEVRRGSVSNILQALYCAPWGITICLNDAQKCS